MKKQKILLIIFFLVLTNLNTGISQNRDFMGISSNCVFDVEISGRRMLTKAIFVETKLQKNLGLVLGLQQNKLNFPLSAHEGFTL